MDCSAIHCQPADQARPDVTAGRDGSFIDMLASRNEADLNSMILRLDQRRHSNPPLFSSYI